MALEIGDVNASYGLAKAINDKLRQVLGPAAESGGANMDDVYAAWAKLSYALSGAIVEYLKANMEIYGITATADVCAALDAETAAGSHAGLSARQDDLLSTQSNDGTGHVR